MTKQIPQAVIALMRQGRRYILDGNYTYDIAEELWFAGERAFQVTMTYLPSGRKQQHHIVITTDRRP